MNSSDNFDGHLELKFDPETPSLLGLKSEPYPDDSHRNQVSLSPEKSQENADKFICGICEFQSLIFDEVYTHFRTAHPASLLPSRTAKKQSEKPDVASVHKCQFCSATYLRANVLQWHVRQSHPVPLLNRDLYGNSSSNTKPMYVHVLTHKAENSFECSSCEASFKVKSDLTNHETLVHLEDRKIIIAKDHSYHERAIPKIAERTTPDSGVHECILCSKFYTSAKSLTMHLENVHFNKKVFKCTECEHTCSTSKDLRRHAVTHTTKTPFRCRHCDKRFKVKRYLVTHITTMHTTNRTKRFNHRCAKCGTKFARKSSLVKHKFEHQELEKPVLCSQCPEQFSTVADLKLHYTAVKHVYSPFKFKCNHCESLYSAYRNLKLHIEQKHAEPLTIFVGV